MQEIKGRVLIQPYIGSDILVINNQPLSKYFIEYNGKNILLSIRFCENKKTYTYKGIADIFYFEGKQDYYRGIKYANDFFIDDIDVIEQLAKQVNDEVEIKVMTISEVCNVLMSERMDIEYDV